MKKTFLTCSMAVLLCKMWAQAPTWSKDVAPIIYANCTNCHIEGGIAPWSFVTYDQAVTYGYSIKSYTESRKMPPWPADPHYQRYSGEKVLSSWEIQTIANWVDAGMPIGDTNQAPAKPILKKGGYITHPNLSLKMPDYTVKTTSDEYRCFVLPTGLTTDQYLTSIEVVPGNLHAVHHVLVFHDTSTKPLQLDSADPKPGYLGFGGTGSPTSKLIGVWVPGQEPFTMPPGMGIKLEKKGYIIMQVHYPAGLDNVTDSSRVKIVLSPTPLREVGITPALYHMAPSLQNGPLYIPANQVKTFYEKYTIPTTVSVFAVAPHMHLIGTHIKAFGIKSGSDTLHLVDIPAWDFHWQRTYVFRNVQKVSAGTVLWGEAQYDNTSNNPQNPSSPPVAVSLGESTTDEMMLVYFWYVLYQSGDENIVLDSSAPKDILLVKQPAKNPSISAFPNPVHDILNLSLPEIRSGTVTVNITSSSGKTVFSRAMNSSNGQLAVNLTDLPQGIYIARLSSVNQVWFSRFVKD